MNIQRPTSNIECEMGHMKKKEYDDHVKSHLDMDLGIEGFWD